MPGQYLNLFHTSLTQFW